MMSMVGANSVHTLPDLRSVIVRMVSVGAEIISLCAGARPVAGSFNAKAVTGTSRIVTVVASGMTTTETDFTILDSAVGV